MRWAKRMLEDCEAHHEICKASRMATGPWLPTRLVFLGKPGHNPRLVEAPEMRLEPSSLPLRYTTLSHRWGKTHPLKLTMENRCQFSNGIPCQDIPKTFADAMEITRFLGLEYIWIDSLCIIQGDERDWERECARMADVYRHGYCNIAALEAADSHGGCFSAWDPTLLSPIVVESKWRNQNSRHWGHFTEHRDYPIAEFETAPVHLRGWVLQERLLSRRALHFGRKAITWECKERLSAELDGDTACSIPFDQESRRIPHSYFGAVGHTELSQEEARDLVQAWFMGVVPQYTAAGLTYQTDKYMAISALAREVHRKLNLNTGRKPEVEYLAGHWSLDLEHHLLWCAASPESARRRLGFAQRVGAPCEMGIPP
ncbi:heterokaryon incompatibility protein-domain-containing protein [Chaetomium strumarium]|uniref:Heterokaryon incompatibility protein-domain-containing protein n=1 Tax=Chaetomium strumarium TaxID=1170767 RepID=A0AAJ0M140_9PEZI|nr:heterokaryon incompatibility protein-domain-containing protein [Chaetomium strumarium]